MAELAFSFMDQGRNEEAVSLMENCYELRKWVLGPGHSQTESSFEILYKWGKGESEDTSGKMKETK